MEAPLEASELRVDGFQVAFVGGWVAYDDISTWDRLSRAIAPKGSNDDYALTRSGHGFRRKRAKRSRWHHAFWNAEIRHYPGARGGPLHIILNINPTRYEAFIALGRPRPESFVPQIHQSDAEKASMLSWATLDGNTNYIPTFYRRYTAPDRRAMFQRALQDVRSILLVNLGRSGVDLDEIGSGQRIPTHPWLDVSPRICLNWSSWRVDRLEQYLDVHTPHPLRTVRLGYRDARARLNAVRTKVYPNSPATSPFLASELERDQRALSYSVRTSAVDNIVVYAKAADHVRIERRWVRGDGPPEIKFSEYQSRGLVGLVDWVEAMNPGSRNIIARVERRLGELANANEDGAVLWARMSAIVACLLKYEPDIDDFFRQVIEGRGFHLPSLRGRKRAAVKQLVSLGIFETVEPGGAMKVPCAVLCRFLLKLTEADEAVTAEDVAAEQQ